MGYKGTIRSTTEPLPRDVIERIDSTLANIDPSYVSFTYLGGNRVQAEYLGYSPQVLEIDGILAVSRRHRN